MRFRLGRKQKSMISRANGQGRPNVIEADLGLGGAAFTQPTFTTTVPAM